MKVVWLAACLVIARAAWAQPGDRKGEPQARFCRCTSAHRAASAGGRLLGRSTSTSTVGFLAPKTGRSICAKRCGNVARGGA